MASEITDSNEVTDSQVHRFFNHLTRLNNDLDHDSFTVLELTDTFLDFLEYEEETGEKMEFDTFKERFEIREES